MAIKKKNPEVTIKYLGGYHDENINTRAYHVLTKEQTDFLEAAKAEFAKRPRLVDGPLLGIHERQYKIAASNTNSLQSCLSPQQVKCLYNCLLSTYIAANTDYKAFESIFANDVKELKEPIQLQQAFSNRLLAYFFDRLYNYKLINSDQWQSVLGKCKLFSNYTGKLLIANDISKAKSNYENNDKNPRGYNVIDTFIQKVQSTFSEPI